MRRRCDNGLVDSVPHHGDTKDARPLVDISAQGKHENRGEAAGDNDKNRPTHAEFSQLVETAPVFLGPARKTKRFVDLGRSSTAIIMRTNNCEQTRG
jgi:hypothetical protein